MSDKITNLKLYSLQELAKLLEVSERTIHNYVKAGKIKGVKIGGKWKFTEEHLKKFISGES